MTSLLTEFLDAEDPTRRTDAEAILDLILSGDPESRFLTVDPRSKVWDAGALTIMAQFITGRKVKITIEGVQDE
jgi:hypothetical protein